MNKKKMSKSQSSRIIAITGIAAVSLLVIVAAIFLVIKITKKPSDAASAQNVTEQGTETSIDIPETSTEPETEPIEEVAATEPEEPGTQTDVSEAEEETPAKTELIMTTDVVKIRSIPSTDGDVLALCDKYDSFTRYDEVDGWSKIEYEGKEGYIKSDYVKVATEDEIAKAQEEANKEESLLKAEATAKTETATAAPVETPAAPSTSSEPAAPAPEVPAPTPEPAPTPAPETPAPAPAPTGTVPYTDKNGVSTTFTTEEWNYFLSYWAYTGQAEYFVHKHTCAELRAMYDATH